MPGVRVKSLKPDEAGTQRVIVEGLRALGFTVLETSVRVRRCPHCGKPGAGRYGTTKGIPDLFVWRWTQGWLGLEVKSQRGRVRPEQQRLADCGAVTVVRSWEEAIEVVRGR